ncbi:MAG: sigma-70 family RNA polymerase sigma factor [Rhodoluna sp.]|nr:sigma-70 family RNA polymerase sigma factor [Rhodoluna sp.]
MSDIINSHDMGNAITNPEEQERKLADFELEIGPHYEFILRASIAKTRSQTFGEELAQAVVLKAFKYWDSYVDRSNGPKRWLNRIIFTTNISMGVAEAKQNKNRVTVSPNIDDDWQEDYIYDKAQEFQLGASAESIVLSQMETEEIVDAIASIDEVFREVVLLNLVDGWKYKEIADFTGLSQNTVGTQIHRARRILRAALREKAIEYGINPDLEKKKK